MLDLDSGGQMRKGDRRDYRGSQPPLSGPVGPLSRPKHVEGGVSFFFLICTHCVFGLLPARGKRVTAIYDYCGDCS